MIQLFYFMNYLYNFSWNFYFKFSIKCLFPKSFFLGIFVFSSFSQSFVCLIYSLNICSPTNFDSNFSSSKMCNWKFCFRIFTPFYFFHFICLESFWTKSIDSNFCFFLFSWNFCFKFLTRCLFPKVFCLGIFVLFFHKVLCV